MRNGADICLVLEGTYPFVSGGVSSWVHHLVTHLPHLRFTVLHISPTRNYYTKGPLYDVPENVVAIDEVHLHEYGIARAADREDLRRRVERFRGLVGDMLEGAAGSFEAFVDAVEEEGSGALSGFHFLQTLDGWDVLVDTYRREAEEESFLNFFWTWRFAFLPLFNVLAAKIPRAHVYHTVSTGYAGLLAAAAKVRTGMQMILTEHGIYTKERRIEINRAEWIEDWDSGEVVAERTVPYFKRYWIRQFQMMSTVTYDRADQIYTLYNGNKLEQIRDGADPRRVTVVPNGIDIDRFDEAAARFDARPPNDRFTIGFIGRVCPIKDVRTLLSAIRIVADEVPDVRVRILGPMEEDPEYAGECQRFAQGLGLGGNVAFEGRVNVLEELPGIDVVV
ncbi:MAG: GT4 family glycosyltransferase PelF, partial [Planctomycetota bacterium]